MIVSPPRQTFRQSRTAAILIAIAATSIGASVAAAGNDETMRVSVAIAVAAGAVLIAIFFILGRRVLTIHDEGVRLTSVFGTRELEWRQIRDYRYRVVPITPGPTNLYLTLLGDNGVTIAVTSAYQDAADAIRVILGALHERVR